MGPTVALLSFFVVLATGQPAGQKPCCESKEVGGVKYMLTGTMDTKAYGCITNCLYETKAKPDMKFCFAPGDLEVECLDDGSSKPPKGDSTKPPKEETSKPPMDGSSKPPMEGSSKPPMDKTSKPPMEETSKPPMDESTKPSMGSSSEKPGAATTAAPAPASPTSASSGCKCGVKRTQRIVGGTETEINEYPWIARVTDPTESLYCGGTLINDQWILTAAHCMFKDTAGTQPTAASESLIVLGEHDLTITTESKIPKKNVKVSQIINHPSYNADNSDNDISLLKLAEKIDLNVYTPACLPKSTDNFEGQKAWVYGWGTTSSGGQTSSKLLDVQVPVVSNAVCKAAMPNTITDAMLCAGGEANKDACQGDSGGPLTVEVNKKHVLIGDVSFGNGCALEGQYGVYGDVAYFRNWIDTTVAANGGGDKCPE